MTTQLDLHLALTCVDPPATAPELSFGLQDKSQALHAAESTTEGALHFQCQLQVRPRQPDAPPDFGGPFVHGTRGDRFLYLSLRHEAGHWVKRIKIPLSEISWGLIGESQLRNQPIRGVVSGAGAARATSLGKGWTVDAA